jgi:hypothetical protein
MKLKKISIQKRTKKPKSTWLSGKTRDLGHETMIIP